MALYRLRRRTRFCLFDLIPYVPVNFFSVMSRRVFMGWTWTKQGLICRAQWHNAVTQVSSNPQSLGLESSTLPLNESIHLYGGYLYTNARTVVANIIVSRECRGKQCRPRSDSSNRNSLNKYIIELVYFAVSLVIARTTWCLGPRHYLNQRKFYLSIILRKPGSAISYF